MTRSGKVAKLLSHLIGLAAAGQLTCMGTTVLTFMWHGLSANEQQLKREAARRCAAACRHFFRICPSISAKRFVWDRIVCKHLIWREFSFIVKTQFDSKMAVKFPDSIQTKIFFFGVWEPEITDYMLHRLRPGDTFIDVGANIGYYTLLASHRVGAAGKVVAIEASPKIFRDLQYNIQLNSALNIEALNAAVCAEVSNVPIYLNNTDNSGGSTIFSDDAPRREASFEAFVSGKPLGELIPEDVICNARLIKIDVEGAEWLVVKGLGESLSRLSADTEVIVEVNAEALRRSGSSPAAFLRVFRDSGFRAFRVENEYTAEQYLRRGSSARLIPISEPEFDQVDIVFRR